MTLLRRDREQWRRGFHYRTRADWAALLAHLGLAADLAPMGKGTAHANILIRATRA